MADFHHSEITCRKVSPPKRLPSRDRGMSRSAPSLPQSPAIMMPPGGSNLISRKLACAALGSQI
jgi:hypothetical protein